MPLAVQSAAITAEPSRIRGAPPAPALLDGATAAALVAYRPDLMRQARRIMPNPTDAQDLVQDTFERAIRAIHQFRPGTNLRAWLYTILVRRAHDHYRRSRLRRGESAPLEALAAPEPDGDEGGGWQRVTAAQFDGAVARLSPRLRRVFELHEMHHLSYQEVSSRLGIPVNTVGTRLRRAREKLRELLAAELEAAGTGS